MNGVARRSDNGDDLQTVAVRGASDLDMTPAFTARTTDTIGGPHNQDRAADAVTLLGRDFGAQTDGGIVYKSEAIRSVLTQVHDVAPTSSTVLLLGETGVGKEMFAQAIHEASPRRHRPMIRVSCAALPATLIESELFGHERGAFTDARARRIGRFEAANESTLFLDEIGELSLETQVRLLRVLENRTIERLGAPRSIKVDVRIIAATNRDLGEAVRTNAFREDLFYRLNVFPITIPPLRERKEDIPALALALVEELSARFGKTIAGISNRSLVQLQQYTWPGNVRELRNVIERAMVVAKGPVLMPTVQHLRKDPPGRPSSERLEDVQDAHIRSVLESCRWIVRGKWGAAERLGLKPTTLEGRMAKLGILRSHLITRR